MPRLSRRFRVLSSLASSRDRARRLFVADNLHVLLDGDYHELNTSNETFMFLAGLNRHHRHMTQSRYIVPRFARKHSYNAFLSDLNEDDSDINWLSDDEFLCKYRMDRQTLDAVTNLIKGDPVFNRGSRGPKQMPVKHQLMIFMHFIGREGENNSNQRSVFKVSEGHCEKARDRVVTALTNLREEYIHWPNADERKQISRRIEKDYHIPNCVGMMDGTLLELGITPRCDDKADYSGRKFRYSLTVNVINDDKRRIRGYLAGYPGSTHDNRVWRNMRQCQRPGDFFSPGEFVVADTAYEPSNEVIPAFKSSPGMGLLQPTDKQTFNLCLASPRVTAEHTVGLWKGRCGWLRKIRMIITNEKESLEHILNYIDATIVLHNMLIDMGSADDENAAWDVEDEVLTAIDDDDRIPERSALDVALPEGSLPFARRDQLLAYIRETYVRKMNFNPVRNSVDIELDSISEFESLSDAIIIEEEA
jgi:hypothetical protein